MLSMQFSKSRSSSVGFNLEKANYSKHDRFEIKRDFKEYETRQARRFARVFAWIFRRHDQESLEW